MTDERCVFRTRGEPPKYIAWHKGLDVFSTTYSRRDAFVAPSPSIAEQMRNGVARELGINPTELVLVSPEERK